MTRGICTDIAQSVPFVAALSRAAADTATVFARPSGDLLVKRHVFAGRHQLEVLGTIVASIIVQMMHVFRSLKWPSQRLCHDIAMLKNVAARASVRMVWHPKVHVALVGDDSATTPVRRGFACMRFASARLRTESTIPGTDVARPCEKGYAAVLTSSWDARLSMHRSSPFVAVPGPLRAVPGFSLSTCGIVLRKRCIVPNVNNTIWILVGVLAIVALAIFIVANVNVG